MKLNLKEKYLIILVVLCFISVGFYYSYAIFVTKQLQENVVIVKVEDNRVDLSVDGKLNKVNVNANSTDNFMIKLNNNQDKKFYYLVLVKGMVEGVKISSINDTYGIINQLETKDLLVHVNNTSNMDIELEFIVKIGEESNIDKDLGYNYINGIDSFDHSGANKPELNNLKLLPVSYKKISDTEGYWYKADVTNQVDLWYSYENGIWANAVLLKNYDKYKDKSIGTEIDNSDISGFYVWIPRFKYSIINSSNYTNYERMVNILFEKDNNSTGTVKCTDKISILNDSHIFSEICNDEYYNHIYDNLSTYTHPSFKNKNGFWVSKFLIGSNDNSLPNVNILKKNIDEAGIISNRNNSHVLTNMEYGAIILLSNSSYGKTNNNLYYTDNDYTFTRIYSNTYENYVTGCSSEYNSRTKNIITEKSKKCIKYNDLTNYSHVSNSVSYKIGYVGAGASSTGTIYGVYDLASINGEIVSAYTLDNNGIIKLNTKYYDVYSYNDYLGIIGSSNNIHNIYRYKLGDGIKEHFRNFGDNGMWNSGVLIHNSDVGIMVRGLSNSVYSTSIEEINYKGAFRTVLN